MYFNNFPKDFLARSEIIHPVTHHPLFTMTYFFIGEIFGRSVFQDGGYIFGLLLFVIRIAPESKVNVYLRPTCVAHHRMAVIMALFLGHVHVGLEGV